MESRTFHWWKNVLVFIASISIMYFSCQATSLFTRIFFVMRNVLYFSRVNIHRFVQNIWYWPNTKAIRIFQVFQHQTISFCAQRISGMLKFDRKFQVETLDTYILRNNTKLPLHSLALFKRFISKDNSLSDVFLYLATLN